MAPSFNKKDSALVMELHALSKRAGKLVKSSVYQAPSVPEIVVRSWKMNEFKYYDIPSPFPTLARGLFTVELPTDEGEDRYRIVARGYDKFFNIGEVPWTTWPALEAHTAAPYTLSLKSNGCIIFIAALTQDKILVTSKHSLGPVSGVPISHAEAGERWLRKYLEQKGRTEADLAGVLWENNWTAIAELCDDSFEEHVLGYPPEKTGLHLHGLNVSTKDFVTMPHEQVDAFADEWGFIKTPTHTVSSIAEVREFTDAVSSAGEWNGEAVEGFVVRTHVTEPPTEGLKGNIAPGRSPYAPGSSFFFKVKFDEPYMMYRDWREVTKSLLSNGTMKAASLPKSKMKRKETRVYVNWVISEIKKDPDAFKEYTKGKGIIATRERFLNWLGAEEGKKALGNEDDERKPVGGGNGFGKTVILPIAIPGCGKTAVAIALAKIFGFGHTQSDDVSVKKSAPVFLKNVVSLLQNYDVVIADKNNHLRQHRQGLRGITANISPPVRLIALNWALDKPPAFVHRICGDRVLQRGERHQTLRADADDKSHEDVIWKFITSTEELADAEVDATIEMDLEETLEESVCRAVDGLVRILGLPKPTPKEIDSGVKKAREYDPDVKQVEQKVKKQTRPRYFALLPEVDLLEILDKRFLKGLDISQETKDFWKQLKDNKRISSRPHVTIVHEKSLPGEIELWDRCTSLQQMTSLPPLFKGKLGSVVWNHRVMAVTLEDLIVDEAQSTQCQTGHEFVAKLPHEVRVRLHITIATKDNSVPPVEAKKLVEGWREGIVDKEVNAFKLSPVVMVTGRVKGLYN
ncbi:RNA ligase-domain-containing protein [Crucibulum laeve]|uniref:tRNA ligase n=1 Tax=Crucibulum laeve TaxID=68775 RepID=A0A5C3LYM6_9AGAR|nr:RNA ligase-domain-containing protein [Crucibulum laeve]